MKRTRDGAKRLVFAAEYVTDLRPGPAAIRAGYSRKTPAPQHCKLLRDPAVQAEVQRLQARKLKRVDPHGRSRARGTRAGGALGH